MFLVWISKGVPQTEEVMSLSVLWFSSLLSLFQPICCHFICRNKLLFQGHVACYNWTLTGPPCSFQSGSSFHIFLSSQAIYWIIFGDHNLYRQSCCDLKTFFLCLQKWETKKTVNTIITLGCDRPSRKKAFNSHNTPPPPAYGWGKLTSTLEKKQDQRYQHSLLPLPLRNRNIFPILLRNIPVIKVADNFVRGLILGVNFENAQNIRGVEI